MTEYLDILNEQGEKVGTAPRSEAHAKGLLHRVAHCWVVSRRGDGVWVWFQQRARDKADFPCYYDIAVGGHVGAGEKPLEAMVREIREEIGLTVPPKDLLYLGAFRDDILLPGFDDRELAEVFLYLHPAPDFRIGEEVERMIRLPQESLLRKSEEPVTAYTVSGEPVVIRPEEWCRHDGEIERFLLPAFQ
ncbi:MAG: NUDIX domain-containing protein [Oscillospiraceae bacterium]|nr:NUDIX domain-containing protein [Oscillospiraceae bacterium]